MYNALQALVIQGNKPNAGSQITIPVLKKNKLPFDRL